jgi:hypothetical protein
VVILCYKSETIMGLLYYKFLQFALQHIVRQLGPSWNISFETKDFSMSLIDFKFKIVVLYMAVM